MGYSLEQQRENRKKLVAALRSGQYRQGKFGLHDHIDDKWCCLGVACHVAGLEPEKSFKSSRFDMFGTNKENTKLPREVMEAFGFDTSMGGFVINEVEDSLVALNDWAGLTFDQIADIIEYEPEGLFVG